MDIVGPVREIYDRYGYKTKILNVARRAIDVAESAIKGADMVTMQYDLFMALAKDPWTDGRLADFMAKWAAVHGTDNWITAVKNRARR